MRSLRIGEVDILVVRTESGDVFAVSDLCSHAGVKLSAGSFDGKRLECVAHKAQFDPCSGAVLKGPAKKPLCRYPLKVSDGKVFVVL